MSLERLSTEERDLVDSENTNTEPELVETEDDEITDPEELEDEEVVE